MAIAGTTGTSVNYFTPAAVIRFLAIVRSAGRYGERLLTHRATFNALAQLRHYFYQQLEPLLPYYRIELRSGDLLARLQQDIDQLDNFYLRVLLPIIVALISAPLVCLGLAMISPMVALIMVVAFSLVGLALPLLSFYLARNIGSEKSDLESRLKLELVTGFGAIRELVVYQMVDAYQASVSTIARQFYQLQYQLAKYHAGLTALTFLITHFAALGCLFYLAPAVVQGTIDPKVVVAVTLLILVSFETVMALPLALQILPHTLASATRLFELIDRERPSTIATTELVAGDIVFNQVSFNYPNQVQPSLSQINLTIVPGQKIAIIGASGAGKSTLVNLLMGFWPTSGITIAGVDLNLIERESLRNHIGLMSQQGHLFDATIGDNLRLANPQASEQQMRDACDSTGLLAFIDSLPQGFDTWLGETGTGLSGGQMQRLQLAQLLLRPAKVLILDEPTKGLDRRSEQLMMTKLFTHVQQQQQSLIIISHKPLMLQRMDQVFVMAQGQIIAQGNHQQLVQSNQYYRQLLNYF
ncbi:MAG: thiol reductant ABC exporter subunit CydC, partial [Gammaproteobacteria bacterium]|nr:thiol reductant ABC exporter subunit CydC [Gammaproteobacteria bacterium]